MLLILLSVCQFFQDGLIEISYLFCIFLCWLAKIVIQLRKVAASVPCYRDRTVRAPQVCDAQRIVSFKFILAFSDTIPQLDCLLQQIDV